MSPTGDIRDSGLIPESGRSPAEGHATSPRFLPRESYGYIRGGEDMVPEGKQEEAVTRKIDTIHV